MSHLTHVNTLALSLLKTFKFSSSTSQVHDLLVSINSTTKLFLCLLGILNKMGKNHLFLTRKLLVLLSLEIISTFSFSLLSH